MMAIFVHSFNVQWEMLDCRIHKHKIKLRIDVRLSEDLNMDRFVYTILIARIVEYTWKKVKHDNAPVSSKLNNQRDQESMETNHELI
ncbi:hypothetical protein BLOT_007956 [Blomia tropicalis]|nr:hypothetical protein BLOT_007956 [Blomia tropicalis]